MSALLCCRPRDMGAALSQEGGVCDAAGLPVVPPTMADVIRERKKKAGGAALGTLRRRLAAAARRPRDQRPDRGCEHARFIRSVVSSWRLAEVFVLHAELEAAAALRDLATQAELARPPAAALHRDLQRLRDTRWWCDVELVGAGWSIPAHRAILAARSTYFRHLLPRYPSARRVPLDASAAALSRDLVQAALVALYGGAAVTSSRPLCDTCNQWDRGGPEADLDIINVDSTLTNSWRGDTRSRSRCRCGRGRPDSAAVRRLTEQLGISMDSLHQDMKYLLDSGEYADARLSFRASFGFSSSHELPCHRAVLAARSRLFRKVMSGRCGAGGVICIDEKVLPRRFARALLHAAYTDQVDLSLIARGPSSPTSTGSSNSGTSAWPGVARGAGADTRNTTSTQLEDAFQLYEIARFMEMPILAQGCEDAIVSLLSANTLPRVLRWGEAGHASRWVHRQAMRYLLDEFPAVMSSAWGCRLPRAALAAALRSPSLQASELQALRALIRWGEADAIHQREPNVVWHTAHSVSRRGGRRRSVSDACVRQSIGELIELVRIEHIPPDNDVLQQAIRRGLIPHPPSQMVESGSKADAWLARGAHRPPRCFLPYLDEIKALLEDQAVPEAELARVRRTRYLHRIPDTLYMVAAERGGSTAEPSLSSGLENACVSAAVLRALRARQRELRASPPTVTALALPMCDREAVYRQIALRCVREMSLPDGCADLLLAENDEPREREGSWSECDDVTPRDVPDRRDHCCRSSTAMSSQGSLRSVNSGDHHLATGIPTLYIYINILSPRGVYRSSTAMSSQGSLRSVNSGDHHLATGIPTLYIYINILSPRGVYRSSTAMSSQGSLRSVNSGDHHLATDSDRVSTCRRRELPALVSEGQSHRSSPATYPGLSLPDAVPDVARGPDGNTHLLCQPPPHNFSGMGVLQLDLGDGATHTPRPGSRALRAATQNARHHREQPQLSVARSRPPDDELRAAIELSVIRAYSSYVPRPLSPAPPQRPALTHTSHKMSHSQLPHGQLPERTLTLPHRDTRDPRDCRLTRHGHSHTGLRSRLTPSPVSAASSGHLSLSRAEEREHADLRSVESSSHLEGSGEPSPRRHYRLEPSYSGSGHSSRGPSPNNYA